MVLKGIMLKWNRSDRERQRQWYHLHVKSKNYNKPVTITKKRETQINREQTSGYQRGERRQGSVGLGD